MKNITTSNLFSNSSLLVSTAFLALLSSAGAQVTEGAFSKLKVGDTTGSTTGDGTVVAEGKHGVSPLLPAVFQTEGSRMLWYPRKSAFRAGEGDSGIWAEAEMGSYSTAFGFSNTASGWGATAMGSENQASGYSATTMGDLNIASGGGATAMGVYNIASSYAETVVGFSNAIRSGGDPFDWNPNDPVLQVGNGHLGVDESYLQMDLNGNGDMDDYIPETFSNALTVYKSGDMELQGDLNLGGKITSDGEQVLTSSSGFQTADLNLGSGSLSGGTGFGISLGNDQPAVNDGSVTISNSNRTIGDYDYTKGFLNIDDVNLNQNLAIDPNQFVTNSKFYFSSEEYFVFRTPEETGGVRETIAEFTTDVTANDNKKASLMIVNGTAFDNQFSPTILGNNESIGIPQYPSLNVVGTGKVGQDVNHPNDFAVINFSTRVHSGEPNGSDSSSFSPFVNKDLFSIANTGQEPALRIAANSDVGFGTKNPEAQLHATKDAKIEGSLTAGGDALIVLQDGSVQVGREDTNGNAPLEVGADGTVVLSKAQGDISMGIYE
ncbi:MAG: hypothetical protein ACSHX7_12170 [Luteolibacter sp.]